MRASLAKVSTEQEIGDGGRDAALGDFLGLGERAGARRIEQNSVETFQFRGAERPAEEVALFGADAADRRVLSASIAAALASAA